jgi:hypothetical protein
MMAHSILQPDLQLKVERYGHCQRCPWVRPPAQAH